MIFILKLFRTTVPVTGIVLLVLGISSEFLFASAKSRPNFVVIMADDLGYGDLSCYGNRRYATPHLDRMAAGGMKFTDFHSNGTVCSPTRAALLTGQYQQRWGVDRVITAKKHRDRGLPIASQTFANLLSAQGYTTAIYGKWHLGYQTKFNPIYQGFSDFRGYVSGNVDFFSHVDQVGYDDWWHNAKQVNEQGYTTHLITQHAVSFLKKNCNKTFCLYLPHEAPHYPYQGPNDHADRTPGGKFDTHGSRTDKAAAYAEMMIELDRSVGVILQTLRELNLEKNTLVLFFSDNGATSLGNNGSLRGTKGTHWEGGHRVPLIAYWPGKINEGTSSDQTAMTFDILPTLLDVAGMKPSEDLLLDGISLKPILFGTADKLPQRDFIWNGSAIRSGDWKYMAKASRGQKEALFNLRDDLAEKKNLLSEHPEVVRQMKEALAQWKTEMENTLEKRGVTPVSKASSQ